MSAALKEVPPSGLSFLWGISRFIVDIVIIGVCWFYLFSFTRMVKLHIRV